ncbi:hypothetical protein Leryth_003401 [Lithospermum erythrorhizon]|nr:hypothetical protein Leryth_003401 [Lithospermum erythrorhizon]
MSTSSVHRLKDRGGATTKSMKPLTPFPEKASRLQKSSSGKENPPQRCASLPRASSVTRTKPMMVSMPRMDKASGFRGGVKGDGNEALARIDKATGMRGGVKREDNEACINKASGMRGGVNEARARWSASSVVSRGRSCSPSEYTRVLSDIKKGGSRISIHRVVGEKKGVFDRLSVSKKSSESGKWGSEKFDKNGALVHGLKSLENKKLGSRVVGNGEGSSLGFSHIEINLNEGIDSGDKGRVLEQLKVRNCVEKRVNLLGLEESRLSVDVDSRDKNCVPRSTEMKSGDESTLNGNGELSEQSGTFAEAKMRYSVGNIVESLKSKELIGNNHGDLTEKNDVFEDVKVITNSEKSDKLTSKGSRLVGRSSGLKEKAVIGEGKDSNLSVKRYPSKLHEKLAFLEGKVKKIASDIKQTKEMLDLNNPDASKVILSDIQEKISGIEKAMGNVISVGNANVGVMKDDGKVTESTKQEEMQVGDGKRSVKGLSVQELEARLFPHQKFLKDRTSLNPSLEMSQIDESRENGSTRNQKQQDKATSIEPIALEILESLKSEQSGIPIEYKNEDTESSEGAAHGKNSASLIACQNNFDFLLTANEKLEEFDEQEITSRMVIDEDNENSCAYMLKEIGHKISTGGWFVSEGEAVLLAHNDGSCSYYDITNCEAKAEYKPPAGISPNMWRDCWIVRAPSADGCAGRYVVAASAGNSLEAGFCSWDFYLKDVRAVHVEDGTTNVRTALADLPNNTMRRRNTLSSIMSPEHQQWFYRPCGPLIVSTASCQRSVKVYDIRDGEHVMRWELQKPVATMEYSSPLQWRNKGKVVVAESETISLYDVSSLSPQPLLSVSSSNRKITALHVNNTDAELGGGVRQRVSSSEVEGNDGVFCTADSINVLDFRQPSGIGLKIPRVGVDVQSTFSRGDSVLLGCTSLKSAGKKQFSSQIQQFSLRKQGLSSAYVLPDSNAHPHYKAITQVWGNSNLVMGVCGLGLCVYDSSKDEVLPPYTMDSSQMNNVKEVIGPDDLYYPSFDYMASQVLLISRDRPALWRYLS